jgi:hypothetical protein
MTGHVSRVVPVALVALVALVLPLALQGQVLTVQYDNARTGATLTETTLTPATVTASRFGKLFTLTVDGDVYAQPLYVPRVTIPGKGVHDVLYVATEHDSVYAFDAAGHPATPLWHVNFLNEKTGVTTLPGNETNCPFINPEVGITPTPVIDRASGTIYVLARTKESRDGASLPVQRLHALSITTGAEKLGGPVEIQAAGFDPLRELPRAGLLLSQGQLYLTWGSSCDVRPYHGWVMAYDARTLKQTATLNTSPDGDASGIWQSDNGPAADANGHVYVITGNGTFDVDKDGHDYGDTAMKLRLSGTSLTVADYFTPANQAEINAKDQDFGAGGPVVLPDQPGQRAPMLVAAGKDGVVYLMNRDAMHSPIQSVKLSGGMYGSPAYWNGHLFFFARKDVLKDFAFNQGTLSETPVASSAEPLGDFGASPVVSANGTRDGIVWVIQTKMWNEFNAQKPAVLRAYDAANVARELYTSEQNPTRDRAGLAVRFTLPTIASGRVYVPVRGAVSVFGLLPPP